MRLLRSLPRDAVELFLWTRAAIWLAAIFAVTPFDPVANAFQVPMDPRWAPYGVLVFAALLLPLSTPTEDWPLLSMPRFGLSMFPIFLALGALGERPGVHVAIVALSSFLLAIAIVQWTIWAWVS